MKYGIVIICALIIYIIIHTYIFVSGRLREYEMNKNYRKQTEQNIGIKVSDKEWNEFMYGDAETIERLINKWKDNSE